jgi:hypothetical protein
MAIGGWRTRTVFERYAIVKENDIPTALNQLEQYRTEQRAKAVEIQNDHTSGTKNAENEMKLVTTRMVTQ